MNAAIIAAGDIVQLVPTELPIAPIFYGLITLSIFTSLAVITRSWKGISNRH